MMSSNEISILSFEGFEGDSHAVQQGTQMAVAQGERITRPTAGALVAKEYVIGTKLAIETRHDIQVFFIGIGGDADMDVGRMLAGATGAEFQGVAEDDLAEVLEEFSRYF